MERNGTALYYLAGVFVVCQVRVCTIHQALHSHKHTLNTIKPSKLCTHKPATRSIDGIGIGFCVHTSVLNTILHEINIYLQMHDSCIGHTRASYTHFTQQNTHTPAVRKRTTKQRRIGTRRHMSEHFLWPEFGGLTTHAIYRAYTYVS